MDDKGIVICSADIDEGLTLQIWTKGAVPRLGVLNRVKNTRKLMPFSWLEREDRTISLKGAKGKTNSYTVESLEEPVRRMLYQYAQDPVFKGLLWHTVIFMSDLLHTPRAIFDRTEFAMLHEDKRCRLWLLDLTEGDEHGYFRPFFPRMSAEEIFGDAPGIFSDGGKTVADLKKTGVTRNSHRRPFPLVRYPSCCRRRRAARIFSVLRGGELSFFVPLERGAERSPLEGRAGDQAG